MDDFSNHPRTIGELRTERDDKSRNWTVRDMLISLLRDIDSGKGEYQKADRAVLIIGNIDPQDNSTDIQVLRAQTGSPWESMGMLHEAMAILTGP